jgi:hypothetical protein
MATKTKAPVAPSAEPPVTPPAAEPEISPAPEVSVSPDEGKSDLLNHAAKLLHDRLEQDFAITEQANVENAAADTQPLADRITESLCKQLDDADAVAIRTAVEVALESVGELTVSDLLKKNGSNGLLTIVSPNPDYTGELYGVVFHNGKAVCMDKQAKRLQADFPEFTVQ